MRRRAPRDFGPVSRRERREADLFFAALMGHPVPRPRAPLALPPYREDVPAEDIRVCGVFGPGAVRPTVQQVRDAVVARAQAEWAAWHTGAGVPLLENAPAQFGRLVGYFLAANAAVLPDALTAIQARANATSFSTLLGATGGAAATELARLKTALAGGTGLESEIGTAIAHAREAFNDSGSFSAWSAVFVSSVVRGAAITLGLEAALPPSRTHVGADQLLKAAVSHATYTLEARRRRAAGIAGTYHAFTPAERAPQTGDIVVMDRRENIRLNQVTTLATLPASLISHGDVVVDVQQGFVVTVGGNVCNSVRRRRFPRGSSGLLTVDRLQLYMQEDSRGGLGPLPLESCREATQPLDDRSTARIFAVLGLVQECRTFGDPPASLRNLA